MGKTNPKQSQFKPNTKPKQSQTNPIYSELVEPVSEPNSATSEAEAGVSVLGDSTCDHKVDFRDFVDLARCWLVGIE